MRTPFVFFDMGQTLIDEWDFISYFDTKFCEILNGFGARIDIRNYRSMRDSLIRGRRIGNGSVTELVREVCRLVLPSGYENAILARMSPEIAAGRDKLFKFSADAEPMLTALDAMNVEMGLIANQSRDIVDVLERSGLQEFFKVKAISATVGLSKPDLRMFEYAVREAKRTSEETVMVGDRLDTDICPANKIGMTTVRHTNSLFSLQEPQIDCERATYTAASLKEIPELVRKLAADTG